MKHTCGLLALVIVGVSCSERQPDDSAQAASGVRVQARATARAHARSRQEEGRRALYADKKNAALERFREALALDPELWEARYDLAITCASVGQLATAERELLRARKESDGAAHVILALADVQRRRGEARAATLTLSAYVKDHPESVEARTRYVKALREAGEKQRSIEEARTLLAKRPEEAVLLSELALSYVSIGDGETARAIAAQALAKNPGSAAAEHALGLLALKEHNELVAVQYLLRAIEDEPGEPAPRLVLARLFLEAGVLDKAEEQFRGVLEISPENREAHLGLAAAARAADGGAHP